MLEKFSIVNGKVDLSPRLREITGIEECSQDVYLFVGSQLPGLGEAIREAGYDPDRPTTAGIASAKEKCKKERKIAKVVVLASSYGAGAKKIWKTLYLSGIDVSLDAVEQIHRTYWKIFAGVASYGKRLYREWADNGGFVESPFGHPVNVDGDKTKDLVNRVCQKSGHDIHMKWLAIVKELLDNNEIEWYPIIADWHDEAIIECKAEDSERVLEIMQKDSYEILNQVIKWEVQFAGEGQIIDNLWAAKQ